MVRSIGAQLGLLAFGLAILVGLVVGNSPITILTRAVVIMVVACAVGQIIGWAARLILRDHLQRKKQEIDRQHLEAMRELAETKEEEEAPEPATPLEAR
ncbi:MAG: hypothetical protein KJ749_09835 [Planctomycetes bacterium]|nr:hypothetical protein [Planctomycetota bacterium]